MTALVALAAAVVVAAAARRPVARRPPRRHPTSPRTPNRLAPTASATLDRLVPGRVAARRDAQLPDLLDRLAAARRAGSSLGPALAEVGPASPAPLGRELEPVAAAVSQGRSLDDALAAWGDRSPATPDLELTIAALRLGGRAGGEVARAIDRTAATLRERRSLRAEVHALATQARASAAVLVLAPVAFTALVGTVEPSTVGFLLTTPTGLACVGSGLALDAVGAAWMARIVRRAS